MLPSSSLLTAARALLASITRQDVIQGHLRNSIDPLSVAFLTSAASSLSSAIGAYQKALTAAQVAVTEEIAAMPIAPSAASADMAARAAASILAYSPSPPWGPSCDTATVVARLQTILALPGASSNAYVETVLTPMLAAFTTVPPAYPADVPADSTYGALQAAIAPSSAASAAASYAAAMMAQVDGAFVITG